MTADLIVNGIVGILLAATLGFCFVLNRRIAALRRVSAEMVKLISGFESSIELARESVQALKQVAGDTGAELQEKLEAATALRDELAFLTGMTLSELGRLREDLKIEDESAEESGEEIPADASDEEFIGSPNCISDEHSPMTARSDAEKELAQALRQVR